MAESIAHNAIKNHFRDEYCFIFLHGVDDASLVERLQGEGDPFVGTLSDAVKIFPSDSPASMACFSRAGEWTTLFELWPQGVIFSDEVLRELSRGCEVLGVWHLLDSTTRIVHASDGKVLGYYDHWLSLITGESPSRLSEALEEAGFFEEAEEEEEFLPQAVAFSALERYFGIQPPTGILSGLITVVSLP